MFKEDLAYFRDQSVAAAGVTTLDVDANDPSKAYLYCHATNSVTVYDRKPPSRHHHVTTIASFAAAFAKYTGISAVWARLDAVVAVLDDDRHRVDSLTLPVASSPIFSTLASIERVKQQKPLLDLLKHDLKPSSVSPDSFELSIANLRWEEHSTTEGSFGTVKSSMGREITAEVKGEKDIPPEVEFEFEPFPAISEEVKATVRVVCSVTVDPSNQSITVKPYPGELDRAKAKAVEALRSKIAEAIGDDGSSVFAGTP